MPTAHRQATEPAAAGPAPQAIDAAAVRYCAQPMQMPRSFDAGVSAARARAILAGCRKWVNGTDLSYYCFKRGDAVPAAWQGSSADIEIVHECFEAWAALGIGIGFRRIETADDAMLRIGFDPQDGSWSYVGRDLLEIRSPQERTMNLGWPLATACGRDTVLHEIGHTLGLEHEHQNPNAGIVWNRQALLDQLKGPPNHWAAPQVEWNVLRQLGPAEARSATWDPDSIMGFPFAAGLIDAPDIYKDGLVPRGGLSYADKAWVVEAYPGVRAPATGTLKVGVSQLLKLKPGETRCFNFAPPRTRSYDIGIFGRADAVLVLFELTSAGHVQIAGDDDSGTERNARLRTRLHRGRRYQIGLRLYHADLPFETSLMAW